MGDIDTGWEACEAWEDRTRCDTPGLKLHSDSEERDPGSIIMLSSSHSLASKDIY